MEIVFIPVMMAPSAFQPADRKQQPGFVATIIPAGKNSRWSKELSLSKTSENIIYTNPKSMRYQTRGLLGI
jgi:hypothetical protein